MNNVVQNRRAILALTFARLYGYGNYAVNAILSDLGEIPSDMTEIREKLASAGLESDPFTISELSASEAILARADRYAIRYFVFGDPDYPVALSQIPKAPTMLFIRGRWPEGLPPGIAIVGSREATSNGKEIAQRLARYFGGLGWPIISGLALGIDAAAHEGALSANAYTICVLAHGLHKASPKANSALAEKILDSGGAWASEYPPGVEPRKDHFVARNRIQSGLSAGSIIVEGARSSGTMTQAQYSLGQRRRLFAVVPLVPTNPLRLNCEGPTSLVESGQAVPVKSSADYPKILEDLEQSRLRLLGPGRGIGAESIS